MSKCYSKSKAWPCFLKNKHCQKKNRKWTCIHELRCLYIFKQVEENPLNSNNLFEYLVQNLMRDKNFINYIGTTQSTNIEKSCKSSIQQKIYNIHHLYCLSKNRIENLGKRSNYSEATKKIFEKCQDWNIKKLKEEIKNLEDQIDL